MNSESEYHNILKAYNMLLYFAGSMIIQEPSAESLKDFIENENLKNLPVSSSNPTFITAASQLRESFSDKPIPLSLIREDYLRLFKGNKTALAPAFESLHRTCRDINPGQKIASVTEFYNSYGWVSKFKGKIEDDNLGVELLFLTKLIDNFLVLDDEICEVEMRREIRRFIDFHLLSWIAEWNRKVQIHSNTLYFKGIGTLILACTEDIFNLLAQSQAKFFAKRELRN
jgi:TorA maturation chaperone TorD